MKALSFLVYLLCIRISDKYIYIVETVQVFIVIIIHNNMSFFVCGFICGIASFIHLTPKINNKNRFYFVFIRGTYLLFCLLKPYFVISLFVFLIFMKLFSFRHILAYIVQCYTIDKIFLFSFILCSSSSSFQLFFVRLHMNIIIKCFVEC